MTQNINFDKTRIVSRIILDIKQGNVTKHIDHDMIMPNRASFTSTEPYDILHGFGKNEFNGGYISKPSAYSFSISVPANSESDQLLRAIFSTRQSFDMYFHDSANSKGQLADMNAIQFQLIEEGLVKCHINDMSTDYRIGAVPMTNFNGIALNIRFITMDKARTKYVSSSPQGTDPFGRGIQAPAADNGEDTMDDFAERVLPNKDNEFW